MNEHDRLLSPSQVAKILNVSPYTIRNWIRNGTLEATNIRPSSQRPMYRIRESVVNKLLDSTVDGKAC